MFANIKNGQTAKRSFIYQPKKKICEDFLKILWDEGFIVNYKISKKDNKKLQIFLKYKKNKPSIKSIKVISAQSRKIYYSVNQIWKMDSNKSFLIISTSQGLKSLVDCKKYKFGGEPFILIN